MEENKKFFNKKTIIIFCTFAIIAVISVWGIAKFRNSNINRFKKGLESNDIETLTTIYKTTSSYDEKKKIENIFEMKLNEILNQFASNEISYEEAQEKIGEYSKVSIFESIITKTKEKLENIKNSKDNFSKGQNAEENNNLYEAIEYYSKVIEEDTNNYKYTQKYISENKNTLKKNIMDEVDKLIENKDYINANAKLQLLKDIFNEDDNIKQKIMLIKDEVKKQEIEEYRNNQEVSVISAEKHKEWYSDTVSGATVIVKNNTNKVVKSYIVSVLAYDKSGYPLKIEYKNYEKIFNYDGANIQPGATHGKDHYGSIYHEEEKISKVLACVKQVEYYDGTTWENPYYEYWIEQYKEKPIET